MKRNISILLLISCLLLLSNVSHAQTSLKDYLGVISDMPKLFQSLIDNANKLAITVDKIKYKKFSADLEYDITELKGNKLNLLNSLKQEQIDKENLKIEISIFKDGILKLKRDLSNYKDLTKGLSIDGFDAIMLSDRLNADFTKKEQLLNDILRNSKKTNPDFITIKENLEKSIDLLNSTIEKIHEFIAILNK